MAIFHNRLMSFRTLMLMTITWLALLGTQVASAAGGVVFHVDSDNQMNQTLRQIGKQIDAMPDLPTHVILISGALRAGVEGATDENGGLYSAQIEQLLAAGVRIFACETTMISTNISPNDLAFGIETVEAGVPELIRLQIEENFSYVKL